MTIRTEDANAVLQGEQLASATNSAPGSSPRDWLSSSPRRVWRPPTDVYETDGRVVVKVEIAGMREDDFVISYADRRLVIAGCRRDPVGKLIYQNMEIRYGEFRTEVRIGWALDESAIEATYDGGFLFVFLPKQALRHRIPVTPQNDQ